MKFFFVLSLLCSFHLLFWLLCFLCSTSLVKVIGSYTEDEPMYMCLYMSCTVKDKSILYLSLLPFLLLFQTIIQSDCILRGDLANVRIGRQCVISKRTVIRPPFKKFSKGFVLLNATHIKSWFTRDFLAQFARLTVPWIVRYFQLTPHLRPIFRMKVSPIKKICCSSTDCYLRKTSTSIKVQIKIRFVIYAPILLGQQVVACIPA